MDRADIVTIKTKTFSRVKLMMLGGIALNGTYNYHLESFTIERLPKIFLEYAYLQATGKAENFCLLFNSRGAFPSIIVADETDTYKLDTFVAESMEQQIKKVREVFGNTIELPVFN